MQDDCFSLFISCLLHEWWPWLWCRKNSSHSSSTVFFKHHMISYNLHSCYPLLLKPSIFLWCKNTILCDNHTYEYDLVLFTFAIHLWQKINIFHQYPWLGIIQFLLLVLVLTLSWWWWLFQCLWGFAENIWPLFPACVFFLLLFFKWILACAD